MSSRGTQGLVVALLALVAAPLCFAQLFPVSGDAAAKVVP